MYSEHISIEFDLSIEIKLKQVSENYTIHLVLIKKKSRIRETPTLSSDADSRTDTNLKRLRDLSIFFCCVI